MEESSMVDDLIIPLEPATVGSRWAIGTYLRIRPPGQDDTDLFQYKIQNAKATDNSSRSIIELDIPLDADPGLVHNNSATGTLKYEFDNVFNTSASQEDVFQAIAKDKVLDALEGVNCTVFAYGQTGSGKTYSIFGGESFQDRGLIPRALSMLFKELKDRKTKNPQFQFKVRISFTEIYKETVYDLLHQQREGQVSLESYPTVQVMEGEDGIILRNLSVYEITTKEDALKLFFLGNKNRITTATTMNNVSSRSHAIFTIAVDTEGRKGDRTVFTSGKINLVDLAGSERMYKMANTKEAITEAKSINLSLHYLEQVIVCLREQANQMIRAAAAAAAAAAVATAAASSAANNQNNAAAGAAGAGGGLAATASTTSLSSHLGTDDPTGHNGSIKDIPRDPASARQSGASTVSATSLSVHSLNEAHPPPTNANTAATATTTAASNNSNKATSLARIPTANASRKDAKDHHKLSKDAGVDKDNAGIATTTNSSSSNNNSNNVKDEPPSSSSSSKSYFIPYRNSVLTSMLRDSLGGNCRSSFLLTISPCKLHFEETVATCRFGQRCGEVKVKVQANTEISLFDQLKDLQHKIKVQERRYLTLDEQRKQIERLLTAEQELRAIQTSIRALTPHEKIHCKTCVQELLAQAKDSLAIATQHVETNPDLFGHPPHGDPSALVHHSQHPHHHHEPVFDHIEDAYDPPSSSLSTALVDANGDGIAEGTILPPLYADPAHNPPDPQQQHQRKQALIKDMANDLVEKTQDELYSQLETMDKAVLVELATALGGLVQSLFIDREMIKQEMLLQEMARQQALQDHYLREQLENQRRMVFRRAPIDELLRTLDTLPDTVIQALVYGTMFLKHSSSKGFLSAVQTKTVPRYVSVSPDLRYLLWRTIESHHSGGNGGIGSGGTTAGAHHVGGGLGGGGHGGGAGGNKLSSMLSAASNNTNTNAANNNNNKDVNRRSLRAAFGLLERTNSTTAATSGAGAGGGGGGGGGNAAGNNHSSNTLLLPPPNPNNYVDETTTASGAEDVVSIPLTAFDSVEYHPVTRTIELRPKPGQTKPMLLEFLGQNHTVGCMAELFHQPQYQMTAPASSAGPTTAASFTFLDFVLSAEEWVKALRYLIARSASAPVSATASPQQHQQQMVYYGA